MNKKTINFSRLAVVVAMSLTLFVFSNASQAEEAIARVIVSSGQFTAIQPDGKERVLKRRSAIFEGDTLKTAKDARAQIRFKDGALIDIQAATQLRLDEYNYQGKVDGTEKNTMSLIKGGFRTITGVVGKKNKKNYKVNTPVATIGIRGTHYGLHYCGGDCGVDTGNGQFQNKKGLYGGVVDGAVVANNDSGEIRLGNDEYFHVASSSSEPQVLLTPPAIIFQGSERQATVAPVEGGQSTTETTAEETIVPDSYDVAYSDPDTGIVTTSFQAPVQPTVELATQEPVGDASPTQLLDKTTLTTWSDKGIVGGIAFNETGTLKKGVSGMFDGTGTAVAIDANNDPVSFYHVDTSKADLCNPCTFDVNNAATAEDVTTLTGGTQTNATTGTTWGRWVSADYIVTENGTTVTTGGPFHFVYSNNVTPNSRLSVLADTYGDAKIYSSVNTGTGGMILGSDSANTNIVTGSSSMTVTANFLTQAFTDVDYTLTTSSGVLSDNIDVGSISVRFADAANSGIDLTGSCISGTCSGEITSGNLNAIFVGNNAEGAMGTFSVETVDGSVSVSGVALMTPTP